MCGAIYDPQAFREWKKEAIRRREYHIPEQLEQE
jgi:hypothetical protein